MSGKKVRLSELYADTLRTWRTMDAVVMTADEPTLRDLLEAEKTGKGRRLFLQRIYGRLSRVRAKREAAELKAAAKDV